MIDRCITDLSKLTLDFLTRYNFWFKCITDLLTSIGWFSFRLDSIFAYAIANGTKGIKNDSKLNNFLSAQSKSMVAYSG